MDDPVVPPGKPPQSTQPSLELVLAKQANDAMARGADPKQATAMLGTMLKHIRANPELAAHGADALSRGADPGQVAHKVWEMASGTPAPAAPHHTPGEQFATMAAQGASLGFGGKVLGAVDAANKTLPRALGGESAPLSDFGKNYTAARDKVTGIEDEGLQDHPIAGRAVEVAAGALPALVGSAAEATALVAKPAVGAITRIGRGMLTGAKYGAAAGAGHATGDAGDYAKEMAAGAATGAVAGGTLSAAGAGLSAGTSKALDAIGRPAETRPVVRIGRGGIGQILGVADRAAQLNAAALPDALPVQSPTQIGAKPLAPIDAGVRSQRLGRGLKTASPAAETVLRDALQPRAEGAVDRVIQHGLEATGLQSRESGLQVVDDLIAQRAQHGRENFQPVFAAHPDPIADPEFHEIASTPAGQQALKRGMTIAANRGESIGHVDETATAPHGIHPEDWANIQRLAKERGMELPQIEGTQQIAPTLQQAHHIKLGFDDMLNSAPEPGTGGSGPNNAAAIRGLKNRWLGAMDRNSSGYAEARKQFADESDLVRAAELGRKMWSMRPDVLEKQFAQMSTAEQDVARRAGFDGFAERVENGPVDVERGISKPRDQRRLRLLFPDDKSFAQFQEGLKHEATMHATAQSVLGGSISADKFADMAGMAGVTIPDVLHAATGRTMPLIGKGIRAVVASSAGKNLDQLAAERARQLVGAPPTTTRLRVPRS